MSSEVIINVAPVPGEKQEENYPGHLNVVEEAIGCCEAGAGIVHLHARDERNLQTADPTVLLWQVTQIRKACPMIIEGSTGGVPEHTLEQRCATLNVPGVELGSLNIGSVNMGHGVYQNSFPDVCFYARRMRAAAITPMMVVFDLSHLANFKRLADAGEISAPYLFEFIFDVPFALPYSDHYLKLFVAHLPPRSVWFCGRYHLKGAAALKHVMDLGGHIRLGYEDSPFLSKGGRARTNVELVEDAVEQAEKAGFKVARAQRAREIVGLKPALPEQRLATKEPAEIL